MLEKDKISRFCSVFDKKIEPKNGREGWRLLLFCTLLKIQLLQSIKPQNEHSYE
jgi:hypothetical protein